MTITSEIVRIKKDYLLRKLILLGNALLISSYDHFEIDSIDEITKLKKDLIGYFNELFKLENISHNEYLNSLLFIQMVTDFEITITEILNTILLKYPNKIGSFSVTLSQVLDKGLEEIVQFASSCYFNQIMYKKPLEYFEEIKKIISYGGDEVFPYWKKYVEIKARRDLGLHNNWKNNETYKRKISEIGDIATDEPFLLPTYEYFHSSADICEKIITIFCEHIMTKFNS